MSSDPKGTTLPPDHPSPWDAPLISVRLVLSVVLAVLICAGVYIVAPPLGSVSGDALAHSVASHVEGATSRSRCTKIDSGIHRCLISDDEYSGGADYRVEMRSYRCWTAIKVSGSTAMQGRGTGCAGLRDQLRVLDRFVG